VKLEEDWPENAASGMPIMRHMELRIKEQQNNSED